MRAHSADPLADGQCLAQTRVAFLLRERPEVLPRRGDQVEGDELQPIGRDRTAAKYPARGSGEVLRRLTDTLGEGDGLAVKCGSGRNVGEGCKQRSKTGGEVGAVTRPPAHLSPIPDVDQNR